jgi:hypothetical protein
MYTIPEVKLEIRLISHDGTVMVYPDYDTFIEEVDYRFIEKYIVTSFKEWPNGWFHYWKIGHEDYSEFRDNYPRYIVRDKLGGVYSPTEILHDKAKFKKQNPTSKYLKWVQAKYNFIYRETPVPRTGSGKRKRWKFGNYYKTPRYAQEKRWNLAHKEYVRGKRRPSHLPDTWDDMIRSDIRERKNWKRRRKTQWK